ncbi:MAG: acyl-CoA dehydrogenase [Gammaproteobacteria bacterium]|nr:acyl-CoA dehydrogenase [Gammaproteobacteria bacterium]
MTSYSAPMREMQFTINELAEMEHIAKLPGFEDATPDLIEAVLEEAGKLASGVLAPINTIGDQQGSRLVDGKVQVPDGFAEAYQQFAEGGWMGISQNPDYGGQGLPHLVQTAVSEMWNAANISFGLNPLLTTGAIEALSAHADDQLKETYLPHMISGEWSGTMDLTEPQAGSDLSAVRTKAVPHGDHYLISGQKIFITWGDHELNENVIHLVLARLPDAPEGVKGISLFLVPKFLVQADGSKGERNDVHAVSLEHKLGVHASPTCVMSFGDKGGAVGYLVGSENQGLSHMFTMMNHARLGVGMQGVAIADRAYQQALEYARDRVQGSAPGVEGRVPIIHHADVRRMLMLMRTMTEAMRALAYVTAASLDLAHHSEDAAEATHHSARLDLLVPVAKGWCTEIAQEVATLGVQVHGGMGFIEETGAAQHFRDARIITIYEGTTGIQAADLVGRKILRDQGAAMHALLEEMETFITGMAADDTELGPVQQRVSEGIQALAKASEWLLRNGKSDPHVAGAVASNLLMLMGTVLGGYQLARAAVIAQQKLAAAEGDADFYRAKVVSAVFYAEHVLPRSKTYLDIVLAGATSTVAVPIEQL